MSSTATSLPGPHLDLVPEMIRFFDAARATSRRRRRAPSPIRVFLRRSTPTRARPRRAPGPVARRHRRGRRPTRASCVLEPTRTGTDELAVRGDVGTTAWISCAGHLPWGQPIDQRPDEGLSLVYDWPAAEGELVVAGHPRFDRDGHRRRAGRLPLGQALRRLPRRHLAARDPWLPQPLPPRVVARAGRRSCPASR